MMKKLSLIMLFSALTIVGFAQTTQEKTAAQQTPEVNLEAAKDSTSKTAILQTKNPSVKVNLDKAQTRNILLQEKEAAAKKTDESEVLIIPEKKQVTPTSVD